MAHPKESSQILIRRPHSLMSYLKESSQILFQCPLSLMSHPKESSQICCSVPSHWWHIQKRAHQFVSEAPLIDVTSKRELTNLFQCPLLLMRHPKESSPIFFRGPSHWCHIQERAHKPTRWWQIQERAHKQCSASGSACFWTSSSGSKIYLYGSGSRSGSYHQQTNKWRKTLISTVLWLFYDFFSLKNAVSVP